MGLDSHIEEQLAAITQLTFQQWFVGRAAYLREFTPTSPDLGEQAMRADYIADKAWWYRTHEPANHATFADAAAAASGELPAPAGHPRSMRRGWLEEIDAAITAAAVGVPSRQWAATLIPADVIADIARGTP